MYDVAAGVERGALPTAEYERKRIASLLRFWSDQLRMPTPRKGRGNPAFKRKLPDDDSAALAVGFHLGCGESVFAVIALVADYFNVDETTVRKAFSERRAAVADFFLKSNLKHRVGAI